MARKNELTEVKQMIDIMSNGHSLKGKTVSVTGHLGVTRSDFIFFVERHGGYFEKTPSYGAILVTNQDWTAKTVDANASLKLLRAKDQGCKIMTESQFYAMIAEAEAS